MASKLHVHPSSSETEATLPAAVLERLGIREGGDIEIVVRRGMVVLRAREGKQADLEQIADEVMDQFEDALRALS